MRPTLKIGRLGFDVTKQQDIQKLIDRAEMTGNSPVDETLSVVTTKGIFTGFGAADESLSSVCGSLLLERDSLEIPKEPTLKMVTKIENSPTGRVVGLSEESSHKVVRDAAKKLVDISKMSVGVKAENTMLPPPCFKEHPQDLSSNIDNIDSVLSEHSSTSTPGPARKVRKIRPSDNVVSYFFLENLFFGDFLYIFDIKFSVGAFSTCWFPSITFCYAV